MDDPPQEVKDSIADNLGMAPEDLDYVLAGNDDARAHQIVATWWASYEPRFEALFETMVLAEGEKLVRELGWQPDPDDPNIWRRLDS